MFKITYYSTIAPFYHIRAKERTKYIYIYLLRRFVV